MTTANRKPDFRSDAPTPGQTPTHIYTGPSFNEHRAMGAALEHGAKGTLYSDNTIPGEKGEPLVGFIPKALAGSGWMIYLPADQVEEL